MNPKCSFCSHHNNVVQVICEGNCVICSKCQVLAPTQKLLLKAANVDITSNANTQTSIGGVVKTHCSINGCCPLCKKAFSRNFSYLLDDFVDRLKHDNDGAEVAFINIILVFTELMIV